MKTNIILDAVPMAYRFRVTAIFLEIKEVICVALATRGAVAGAVTAVPQKKFLLAPILKTRLLNQEAGQCI